MIEDRVLIFNYGAVDLRDILQFQLENQDNQQKGLRKVLFLTEQTALGIL